MSADDTAAQLRRRLEDVLGMDAFAAMPVSMVGTRPDDMGAHRLHPLVWVDRHDLIAATIRRTPHASEGDEAEGLHIDIYAGDRGEVRGRIEGWLGELRLLLDQDAAILGEGGDPRHPGPRYTRCHPLLAEAVAAWGWDVDEVARSSEIPSGMTMVNARYENGLYAEMVKGAVGDAGVVLTRKIVRRRVTVDSLTITPEGGSDATRPRVLFTEQEGVPMVSATPVALPDSVIATLPGRRLGDVIAGGASTPFARFRIERAWAGGGGAAPVATFEIERGETALA